ncbi:LOW QUALITY PROTEIN: 6-phosphogluconate dehydrogenase, decarboxylating-like [Schistocerca gregaria]|uniref:LOW QUALITY PROTEIN: 6-phosphogluconate dehydrogenase, decarboxylating-like n=1 Tax=Schistocerca gregaria TaxID=7010 RepID=UPI00211ED9FA|nr:LOW QUALITY PROTEIN: 6-phosphogluconate dehydrogenase, decarboxylating-like [Schistocerca gregaria]
MSADIGLIGLAVMGENLVLNMEKNGFVVAVFNRTLSKVDDFVNGRAKGLKVIGTHSLEEFVSKLKKPRRVMVMVRAGDAVDKIIEMLLPLLSKGDIIIDGGNSYFEDTTRRTKELEAKGMMFVGAGVSGGEEGALNGPSIMPGGTKGAWKEIGPIFQAIAAKVKEGVPCCEWVGDGGAGHYVKMVHNGHEYSCCQAIAEAYWVMKEGLGMSNEEMSGVFSEWNLGKLESYLIEITAQILSKKDEQGTYVIDYILDKAGQKGTGKWTVMSALELGVPVTLVSEAVFARCLSYQKEDRVFASNIFTGPREPFKVDQKQFLNDLHDSLYASFLVSCAQCFVLMGAAGSRYKWDIDYAAVAHMWRGGCIIRSSYLENIFQAFQLNPALSNLMFDHFFSSEIQKCSPGWRRVVAATSKSGVAIPVISSGLSYYDGLRAASGPANLIQAQRDYFGAHTYERLDRNAGQYFHTDWTGHGGSTHSQAYNI